MNFDDRSPIYRQIADRIEAVLSGALAGDEQVMNGHRHVREQARAIGIDVSELVERINQPAREDGR